MALGILAYPIWYWEEFCVRGRIASLTVIECDDGILKDLYTLPLE